MNEKQVTKAEAIKDSLLEDGISIKNPYKEHKTTKVTCPSCQHMFQIGESFEIRRGMMYKELVDKGYSYREIARSFGYEKGNPQNIKYWIEKADKAIRLADSVQKME